MAYQDFSSAHIQENFIENGGYSPTFEAHCTGIAPNAPDFNVLQTTSQFPVDQRRLLLSFADQYLNEARRIASSFVWTSYKDKETLRTYSKLMATGLACVEAVLKQLNHGLRPRQEALLRLRYATLLYEETENLDVAEELLSRAINLCERNRLWDIKYSMQHLLVRILLVTNPRASMKFLDTLIDDCTTRQHIPWIYSFRLMRVILCFRSTQRVDAAVALSNLRALSEMSKRCSDTVVTLFSALLEAQVYLCIRSSESIDEAQRALATARSYEPSEMALKVPQATLWIHYVDILCSLDPYNYAQSRRKMDSMQTALQNINERSKWPRDGQFVVPFRTPVDAAVIGETNGIFAKGGDGDLGVALTWLSKSDAINLVYLLSGAARYSKNSSDGQKTEHFLSEGLKRIEETHAIRTSQWGLPLSSQFTTALWHRDMQASLLIRLAFAQCGRSHWQAAAETIHKLSALIDSTKSQTSKVISLLLNYLNGVFHQGTGRLEEALRFFQEPNLALPSSPLHPNTFQETVAVLAAINVLHIISPSNHPHHKLATHLLHKLSLYFPDNFDKQRSTEYAIPNLLLANNHLVSAYSYLCAIYAPILFNQTSDLQFTITHTKRLIQRSLEAARVVSDSFLVTLGLAHMHATFFARLVGKQVEDNAKVMSGNARESGNVLWACVAAGLAVDTLERAGRQGDAIVMQQNGLQLMDKLPKRVQEKFQLTSLQRIGVTTSHEPNDELMKD